MRGTTDQYKPINMTAQVADVKTTLGSVIQMLKAIERCSKDDITFDQRFAAEKDVKKTAPRCDFLDQCCFQKPQLSKILATG